jgi:hypothetical protein
MAQQGKPLSADLVRAVVNVARQEGIRAASRLLCVDRSTVRRYVRNAGVQGGASPPPAGPGRDRSSAPPAGSPPPAQGGTS